MINAIKGASYNTGNRGYIYKHIRYFFKIMDKDLDYFFNITKLKTSLWIRSTLIIE